MNDLLNEIKQIKGVEKVEFLWGNTAIKIHMSGNTGRMLVDVTLRHLMRKLGNFCKLTYGLKDGERVYPKNMIYFLEPVFTKAELLDYDETVSFYRGGY